MHRGYTKAYRKELDSQIWLMPPIYHRVWYVLRQKVVHTSLVFPTSKGYGIYLNPGQLLTSYRQISQWVAWEEWGCEKLPNKRTIKKVLEWLKSNGMIQLESNAKGTYINIINWAIYNSVVIKKVTQGEQQSGTRCAPQCGHGVHHGVHTIKECIDKVQEIKNKRFMSPSVEEVQKYCLGRKNQVDAQKFISFYESKGWMIGKNKMKNWKAAVVTWEKNDEQTNKMDDWI